MADIRSWDADAILPFLLTRFVGKSFPVYEHVVDFATKFALDFLHNVSELIFLLFGQVIWLQDASVPLHFVWTFVWPNLRLMYRCYAGFLLKEIDDSFFGISSWSYLFTGSIDHIFVD